MEADIYTHLQWFAALFVAFSHGFEIEGSVLIISEVTSPEVYLYSLGLQADVTIQ